MWKLILIAAFAAIWVTAVSEDIVSKSHGCNTNSSAHSVSFNLNVYNGSDCIWVAGTNKTLNETNPIALFFPYLFLDKGDEVNIYRTYQDAIADVNPLINPLYAQNGSVTVITERTTVAIKFKGNGEQFVRKLEIFYNHGCQIPVAPDIEIIHSPMYTKNATKAAECVYTFNEIQHARAKQVLTFDVFNVIDSHLKFEGSTLDGDYKNENPEDIFIDLHKPPMVMTTTMTLNSSDYFKLKVQQVDSSCSDRYEITDDDLYKKLKSPLEVLNNGSIITECRWVIKYKNKGVLGLKLNNFNFNSIFDIVAVNDGLSELSPPLLQITTSNKNVTNGQIVRATGSYMWVSFKPLTYASSFSANVTLHKQGGYFKNKGSISASAPTGDDTVFLLEVDGGKNVILSFEDSSFSYPATLSIYDGFDTHHLLASLHGQIKYPVVSKSSKMMIAVSKFNGSSHFAANFQGIDPGCLQMSSLSAESYILSQKCNSTCMWVVPPQDTVNSVLLLALQYVSLREGDNIEILQLDAKLTQLGFITANETHVPQLSLSASVGALIKVVQAPCKEKEEKIVLIGHSSYEPACFKTIKLKASEQVQISSPLYPDTYPLFSTCSWTISALEGEFFHMAFQNLKLAENHCVRITQASNKTNITYVGHSLPDDLFLHGDVDITFDSAGCGKKDVTQTLKNDVGFVLNITVADCGAVLDGKKNGEFNTSIDKNKTTCIWKVTVPSPNGDSVNIITYSVTEKDKIKNYDIHVYDGSSVRNTEIVNSSNSEIWSRTNTLIFIYKRLNVSQPSSVLLFKYDTLSCNKSMLCDNKICMHPDWRCNGINDCGDFTDERNCEGVPIPPDVKPSGYSGLTLGFSLLAMAIVGIILGLSIPVCVRKWKDSRYTRFRELSSIDN